MPAAAPLDPTGLDAGRVFVLPCNGSAVLADSGEARGRRPWGRGGRPAGRGSARGATGPAPRGPAGRCGHRSDWSGRVLLAPYLD